MGNNNTVHSSDSHRHFYTLEYSADHPWITIYPLLSGICVDGCPFPKKAALRNIERIALSFGLSIAVSPLIGLALNYTPWGIGLYPVIVALGLFISVTSAVAWQRRRKLPESERFYVDFNLSMPKWGELSRWRIVLSITLLALIFGAIITLVYIAATSRITDRFTEFYILGPQGKATGYPNKLNVGQEGNVTLGIVNREHEDIVYSVKIQINGESKGTIAPLTLANGGKWEHEVSFVPSEAGANQKVEFLLYKNGGSEPYKSLYLWLDVKEQT